MLWRGKGRAELDKGGFGFGGWIEAVLGSGGRLFFFSVFLYPVFKMFQSLLLIDRPHIIAF